MEFDTYGSMRQLARWPDSRRAQAAFSLLLRRTQTRIGWDITERPDPEDDKLWFLHRRMGVGMSELEGLSSGAGSSNAATPITAMSAQEQLSAYVDMVKATGSSVDLQALMNRLKEEHGEDVVNKLNE